ncbi:hypothetical protein J6590_005888 [Homalodisca vitripennis]|nr:hypothetical protein J6590_005888 [Homalodisca vitripennis]
MNFLDYMANTKAWMNRDTFSAWLQSVKDMNKKKKKILIFNDNCMAHGDIPRLSNIRGIIQNFKVNYEKEVVHSSLDMESRLPTNINCEVKLQKLQFVIVSRRVDLLSQLRRIIQTSLLHKKSTLRRSSKTVTFDDDVAVCGELTDADIISSVTSVLDKNVAAEDDDYDEPDCVMPGPNLKEAREAHPKLKRCHDESQNSIIQYAQIQVHPNTPNENKVTPHRT